VLDVIDPVSGGNLDEHTGQADAYAASHDTGP
jgi:hypothetical protein